MEREHELLLTILSDHINGRDTEVITGADWDRINELALAHQVGGIVYHQCRAQLTGDAAAKLKTQYELSTGCYLQRRLIIKRIEEAFTRESIGFITVKGLDVAECYPVPQLRTMGDCDIIVRTEDKEKAHAIFKELGFNDVEKGGNEWKYLMGNLEFELHDHLLYDNFVSGNALRDFAETYWDYTEETAPGSSHFILNWNYHFVYLILHLMKHFFVSGIGLRQFLDLAAVINRQELDFEWISEKLDELELLDFTKKCLGLCERWFGVELPLSERMDDEKFEELTQYVMKNGVFGFENSENDDNLVVYKIKSGGSLRAMLWAVFPPYDNLRVTEAYAFLDGRPWLLPAAWCYRFVRGVKNGKSSHGRHLVGKIVHSGKDESSENSLCSDMGLK
ncbi:MAG: nucleotidyltransferase family protein [Oscillospiraceae bacterium]|nr:nucleotidyltransferase family protein [Oscillospiraceae bacterium]